MTLPAITIGAPVVSEYSKRGQNSPLEDSQIQVGNNRKISNEGFFVIDFLSSAGAMGSPTPTKINLIGNNGDIQRQYIQEIIQGAGDTTAKITKKYTIDVPINSTIIVRPGQVWELNTYMYSSTQTLTLDVTGTYRYLRGNSLTITTSNPSVTLINAGTTDVKISLKYSTTAGDRPIFGLYFRLF